MTLTDEQFESILAGSEGEPSDLAADDRARLAEARAVRGRLRKAFEPVTAGTGLAERIGAALQAETESPDVRSREREEDGGGRRRVMRFARWLAPLAAAAAVLVAVAVFDFSGERAEAAPVQLARIHSDNLAASGAFHHVSNAEEAAEHLRAHLGFTPQIVSRDGEVILEGCAVAEFRGGKVAAYLLTVGGAKVSVIVTEDSPEAMGLVCGCGCGMTDCRCYHTGHCEGCNIMSLRIGDRSYSAVGAVPGDVLKGVLARLHV